ncbi:ribosomal protein L11 methyltransferase [candidate division KSB1 bacterium RBG_16_48_16]|nr:MAG: ribosomal protein L11 methyltransferase [candidate division KSB1 bacterium RBG_16_48_16]
MSRLIEKNKPWIGLSIGCSENTIEPLSNLLFEMGATGILEKGKTIEGYFAADAPLDDMKTKLQILFSALESLGLEVEDKSIRVSYIEDRDWNGEWKKSYHTVRVTENIWIKPSWEPPPQKLPRCLIEIDPEMAFGTGMHETTQMMLKLLEEHVRPGMSVLDIGTGSGILAIAAAKSGAGRIVAHDIDPVAVQTAARNAQKNSVRQRLVLFTGSPEALKAVVFDLILANVNRLAIEKMLPRLKKMLINKSKLIISGILAEEKNILNRTLRNNGFVVDKTIAEGEWIAMTIKPFFT